MRPTWTEIDLKALEKNFFRVREIVGGTVKIMSVVKADAYGHGAVRVSRTLENAGTFMLGVATLAEGLELRESGIKAPIMILSGIYEDEMEIIHKNKLTPVAYSLDSLEILNKYAHKNNIKVYYHLKIDTGMNRLGILAGDMNKFLEAMKGCKNLSLQGIFTHFSRADEDDKSYTCKQLDTFKEIVGLIKKHYPSIPYLHMANSSALQRFPESHYNLVRPGIMLYGSWAEDGVYLHSVMKLKTKIVQIKDLPKGSMVSYGGTFITNKKSRIAVLPVGYADGYSRNLSNKSYVSVNGSSAPVIGRICMDLTIVDVTEIKNINVGDEVTLFGDDRNHIDNLASLAGTISYEMLSLIGKRVPRVYK